MSFKVTFLPRGSATLFSNGIVYRPLRNAPTLDLAVMYRRDDRSELLARFLELARTLSKDGASFGRTSYGVGFTFESTR